ncbi:unnamed protein product, partial [Scytosiphon promiscuus]
FAVTQLCFETCAAKSSLYFALFNGSVCACGDNQTFFTEEKETGYCDMPCSGNTSEMCGGDNDYDMF